MTQAIGRSHGAHAVPQCKENIPQDFKTHRKLSEDDAWIKRCNPQEMNQLINDLKMNTGEHGWDAEFGDTDRCNPDLPMARTFNALFELKRINFGLWYTYAKTLTPQLWARCRGERGGDPSAQAFWGGREDRTQLYLPFFYGGSTQLRASLIAHEARHHDGKDHVECTRMIAVPKESCDTDYRKYDGAYAYQVRVLWDFARDPGTPPAFRRWAGTAGNQLLAGAWFNNDSGERIPPTDYCWKGNFFANAGTNYQCRSCPDRSLANADQTDCSGPCPEGQAPDKTAPGRCISCKPSEVVSNITNNICAECDRIRTGLVPDANKERCVACQRGWIPNPDGSACTACPLNSIVVHNFGKTPACYSCQPFNSIPNFTRDKCVSCQDGKVPNANGVCCVPPDWKDSTWCGPRSKDLKIPNNPVFWLQGLIDTNLLSIDEAQRMLNEVAETPQM